MLSLLNEELRFSFLIVSLNIEDIDKLYSRLVVGSGLVAL